MLILDQLQNMEKFTNVEAVLVSYINHNPQEILYMSADELAQKSYVSKASVIRLCKKLGLKGYKEFRVELARELNSFLINNDRVKENLPFSKHDAVNDIAEKLLNLNYQALTDTFDNLDMTQLKRVADMIASKENISIYGLGISYLIAADFQYKMLRLNKNVHMETIPGFPFVKSASQKETSLAIIVSYYGAQEEHVRIARRLSYNKVPIILLSGPYDNPMAKYATERICVSVHEPRPKVGSIASRTAMNFVLDVIYSLIFCTDYDESVNIMSKKEDIRKLL